LAATVLAVVVAGCGSGSGGGDAGADAPLDAEAPPHDGAADGEDAAQAIDVGTGADANRSPDGADAQTPSDAADTRTPAPDAPLNARYVFKIPVLAEQMVGDPLRRRLYLSVGGGSPQYPNTLLTIDANTGAVVSSPYVGSNPESLALSDDSSILWIGINGSLSIRRVTLTANPPDVGPLTSLTPALGAGQAIGPMVGLSGAPLSVVVSTPDGGKTVVLDDGVARPTSASTLGRSASLLVAGTPGYAYGYDGQDTGFGFLTMAISSGGVSDLSTTPGLIQGFGNQIVYRGGRVYAATGEIVDVSSPARPVAGGRLPCVGPIALGGPNRLFVLTGDVPDAGTLRPTQILVVDDTTLKVVTMIPFPPDLFGTFNDSPATTSFVYLGPDTLAFLVRLTDTTTFAQTGTLVVIRDPLIGAVN
jgi:hypothetical protein